jgi:hypothetical protein
MFDVFKRNNTIENSTQKYRFINFHKNQLIKENTLKYVENMLKNCLIPVNIF